MFSVKEFNLTCRMNGGDLINDFRSPRFGKIGDAFDELGYSILDIGFTIGEYNYEMDRDDKRTILVL
jgi:hypothetical protein